MSTLTPGRQSPFRRQPSINSPNPLRASTPSASPTKSSLLSPSRRGAGPFIDCEDSSSSPNRSASPVTSRRVESVPPEKDGRTATLGTASPQPRAESPVRRLQNQIFSSPSPAAAAVASPGISGSLPASPTTQIFAPRDNLSRAYTPEAAPMRQPMFTSRPAENKTLQMPKSNGNYNNIPAPLLRSLRESFEVLDPNASGSLNPTALPVVLDQIGLPVDSKTLSAFFPASQSKSVNLASYLDMLCGPISELSSQDELAAAFGAFDIDDSGQLDVHELKQALLRTAPEPGETNPGARLSETEIDSILSNFTGRRAFGARNTAKGTPASRGEVFKWRDFVHSVNGGSDAKPEGITA